MKRDNSQVQSSGCSYNNRLQLPAATARDWSCRHFTSPLLRPFHGTSSAINARGMQCEVARGIVGINPDGCRQTPRFARTTRDRHIWDSTQLRQRRSGFTDTAGVTRGRRHHDDGIGTRRVILPLGACRSSRYIPIGNAHLGRRSRYQPLPGSGPRS